MKYTKFNIVGLDFISPKGIPHSIIEIGGKICITTSKDEVMYYEEQGLLNTLLDHLNNDTWKVVNKNIEYEIF